VGTVQYPIFPGYRVSLAAESFLLKELNDGSAIFAEGELRYAMLNDRPLIVATFWYFPTELAVFFLTGLAAMFGLAARRFWKTVGKRAFF
jgi:hypothetical protein